MSATEVTTLDHIDQLTVPGTPFAQPSNEFWALLCLRDGLEVLFQQASRFDEVARQRLNPDGSTRISVIGNMPQLQDLPKSLLTCYFQWYAVSACQYVWTVAAILRKNDESSQLPREYAKQVIPEVQVFRDKVAAHYSWATRNSRDNDAERLASILPPLTFEDDSFFVGGLTVSLRCNGRVSDSTAIRPWSLCKVHEKMRERYWPASINEKP